MGRDNEFAADVRLRRGRRLLEVCDGPSEEESMGDLYPAQAACLFELTEWREDVVARDVGPQLVRLAAPPGWGKSTILARLCDQSAIGLGSADPLLPVTISVRCPAHGSDGMDSGFRFLTDIVLSASSHADFRLRRWLRELVHVLGLRAPETAAETVGQLLALLSIATGVAAPLGAMVWFAGTARRAGIIWMGGVLGLGLPDLDARCYEAGRLIAAASRDQPFVLAIDEAHAAGSYATALVRGVFSVPRARVLVVAAGEPRNGELAGPVGDLAKGPDSVPGARCPEPTPTQPTTAELTWTIMDRYPHTSTADAGQIAAACRSWADVCAIIAELLPPGSAGGRNTLDLKGRDPTALLRRPDREFVWSGDLERLATGLALIGDRVVSDHIKRLTQVLHIAKGTGLTARLIEDGTIQRVTADVYEFVDGTVRDHAVRRAAAIHTEDERALINRVAIDVRDHAPPSLSLLGRLVIQRRVLDSNAAPDTAKSDAHWQLALLAAEVGDFASALTSLEHAARLSALRAEQEAWGTYWRARLDKTTLDVPVVDVDRIADPTVALEVHAVTATLMLQQGDAAGCYDTLQEAASTLDTSDLARNDRLVAIRVALAQLALHLNEPMEAARLIEPALEPELARTSQLVHQLESLAHRHVNSSHLLQLLAHRRAVADARESGHPLLLAGALQDLAVLYWEHGRPREALDLANEMTELNNAELGPKHPDTLYARHMRTNFLSADGQHAKALSEIDDVIALREQVFGVRHHHTAASRHNRASFLGDTEQWQAALDEIDGVIQLRTQLLGTENPETLMSRNNRSIYLHHLDRTHEALEEIDQVIQLRTVVLGAEHPHTLSSRANRASYLSTDRAQEALEELDDLLPVEERVLGHRHPSTLQTRHNRAATLDDLGRSDEALEEIDDVIHLRQGVLGPDHEDALHSRHNRAGYLGETEQWQLALDEIDGVIALRQEVIGPDHEDTLDSRYNRAGYLWELNRPDEALDEIDDVIAHRQSALGPNHEDTLRSISFRQWLCEQRDAR
jgi:tetratricopeptide (TPR) repeat protein